MTRSSLSEKLLWLSGADPDVLRHCPRERPKFVAMGGTVLTTSVLATVAAAFTVHQYLHVPLALALPIALGWGLAIMNLDRWLLISIRRQSSTAKTVLMAVPRVFLALVIGAVIAEPLVLRVFESEVTAQAVRDKQQALAEGRKELQEEYDEIPELKAQQEELEAGLTSAGSGQALRESPEYSQATAQLRRLERQAAKAEAAAACELDGRCGTSKSGAGPVYRAKQEAADSLRAQVEAERQRVEGIGDRLIDKEGRVAAYDRRLQRNALARTRSELRELRAQRTEAARQMRLAYAQPIGLLDRVEALDNLTDEHPAMLAIRIVLFLFILAIDSMPAIAKVLMSIGKPSLYENVQEDLEESDANALKHQTDAYTKASEISASLVVDEATTRKAAVKDVQDELIEQAVDGMREAGEKFVAGWRKSVVDEVPDLLDEELRRSGMKRRGAAGEPPPGASNGGGSQEEHPPPERLGGP